MNEHVVVALPASWATFDGRDAVDACRIVEQLRPQMAMDRRMGTERVHPYLAMVIAAVQRCGVPAGHRVMVGTDSRVAVAQATRVGDVAARPMVWVRARFVVNPDPEWIIDPDTPAHRNPFGTYTRSWASLDALVMDLAAAWEKAGPTTKNVLERDGGPDAGVT